MLRAVSYILFAIVWLWAALAVSEYSKSPYGILGIAVVVFGAFILWRAVRK